MALTAKDLRIGNWIKYGEPKLLRKEFWGQEVQVTIDVLKYVDGTPAKDFYGEIHSDKQRCKKCFKP